MRKEKQLRSSQNSSAQDNDGLDFKSSIGDDSINSNDLKQKNKKLKDRTHWTRIFQVEANSAFEP